MADETKQGEAIPDSPEVHEAYVREELDNDQITHEGEKRPPMATTDPTEQRSQHLGATDDEVTPITPPMAGPADVVGEKNENAQGNERGDTQIGEEMVDPRDHLTPG